VNPTNAAFFVAFLGGGVLLAIGASAGFWLVDRVAAWFSRTETHVGTTDDLAAIGEAVKRHPSTRKDAS
jgi:hypothetical protein